MDHREVNRKWYSSFDEKSMEFIIERDEDDLRIPAIYEVCGTCDGKGKHVNPSIDAHGISPEEFHEDPDFTEDYFSGVYDVPCNECKGNRVSPDVDWDKLEESVKTYVEEWIADFYSYQRDCEMERRMGC